MVDRGAVAKSGGEYDASISDADPGSPAQHANRPVPRALAVIRRGDAPMSVNATLHAHAMAGAIKRQVYLLNSNDAPGAGIAAELRDSGFSVTCFATIDSFFAELPLLAPGCVVTGLCLDLVDGVAFQRELRVHGCNFPVIAATAAGDVPAAVRAMKAGAADVVVRPVGAAELCVAVHGALASRRRDLVDSDEVQAMRERFARLTRRERQVLDGLVNGEVNKSIANELGISPRTVEVHRAKVMEKLACRSLPEIVRLALQVGWPVT